MDEWKDCISIIHQWIVCLYYIIEINEGINVTTYIYHRYSGNAQPVSRLLMIQQISTNNCFKSSFPPCCRNWLCCGWWWYDGMYNIVWTALMSAEWRINVCLHDTHSKYPDFHQPRKPLVQGFANLCSFSRSRNAFIMWCSQWCTSVKVSILNLDRECKCVAGSRAAHCRTAELCSAAVAAMSPCSHTACSSSRTLESFQKYNAWISE